MDNYEKSRSFSALASYVEELHKCDKWHLASLKRYASAYLALQLITLFSGFFTALLAAINKEIFGPMTRYVLVILPLLGSLAAGCLLQFRLYDLSRIRDDARLAFRDLALRGDLLLGMAKSEADCAKFHEELLAKAAKIEKEQADRFYAARANTIKIVEPKSDTQTGAS